jgi:hypothetical protein
VQQVENSLEYYLGLSFDIKFNLYSSIFKSRPSLFLLKVLKRHYIFWLVLFNSEKGNLIPSPTMISPKSFINNFDPFA